MASPRETNQAQTLSDFLNGKLQGKSPAQICALCVAATLGAQVAYRLLAPGQLKERALKLIFTGVRKVADSLIMAEIHKGTSKIAFPTKGESEEYNNEIPDQGLSSDEVLKISRSFHEVLDSKLNERPLSGVVYRGTEMNDDLMIEVIKLQLWSNPVFANYFGGCRKMEAEVSAMMLSMFNAPDDDHCCTYTFGGTESILLCMLAYANKGRQQLGIETPEIIASTSVHPAFDKAAFYFGIKLIKTDVDPVTTRTIPSEVEKYIGRNTVCIIGSTPNYHAGTIDDIEALAKVALKHDIGLHVDACVGGFLIQFMKGAGLPDHKIDFRVKGVTSISCDLHKWGGCPKGASAALFHSKDLRKLSVFAAADFPGYLYATQNLSGSKPGYCMAAAWATLMNNGKNTYYDTVTRIRKCSEKLKQAVLETEGLELMGDPQTACVAFTSHKFCVYDLQKRLETKYNWVLTALQFPAGLNLGLTLEHDRPGNLDKFIEDLRRETAACLEEYKDKPKGFTKFPDSVNRQTAIIPDRSIVEDMMRSYVDRVYTNAPQPKVQ